MRVSARMPKAHKPTWVSLRATSAEQIPAAASNAGRRFSNASQANASANGSSATDDMCGPSPLPSRTQSQELAEKFAKVARSLHQRESAELADAETRAEVSVAQRKSLRIARFLNRLIFCFFAEDTTLLPKKLFSELARTALDDSRQFSQALESLFRTMATGGMFGPHKIRH